MDFVSPTRLSALVSLTRLQVPMSPPCFSRTGRVPRRLPSLDWVLLSRVPQRHQYYEGATTSPSRCPVAYDVRFQVPRGDLSRLLQSGRKSLPDDLARFQCPGPKGFSAWRSRGPHRFPGDLPCSKTPAGSHAPRENGAGDAAPASNTTKAPANNMMSRLDHTASIPTTYASGAALPQNPQGSLPVGR